MRKTVLLAVSALLLGSPQSGTAQEPLTEEKRADIETFLELTNALALGQQMSSAFNAQVVQAMRAANPGIPQAVLDTAQQVVNEVVGEELPSFVDEIVTIYHRHFTREEIRGFIDFYSTDLGRKATRLLPQITQESMSAGQAWGQSLQAEIDRRVRERLTEQSVQP